MKYIEEIRGPGFEIFMGDEHPCTTCKELTVFADVLWEGMPFCSTECLEDWNDFVAEDLKRLNNKPS